MCIFSHFIPASFRILNLFAHSSRVIYETAAARIQINSFYEEEWRNEMKCPLSLIYEEDIEKDEVHQGVF